MGKNKALRAAIVDQLQPELRLTKDELLSRLRELPELDVSVERLARNLGRLIDEGWVIADGERAGTRFRRAVSIRR